VTSSPDASAQPRGGTPTPGAVHLRLTEPFERFYVREFRALVTLAYVLTGSATHAEDLAQDSMMAAYRRWDEVAALDLPSAWCARRCACGRPRGPAVPLIRI
jgi:predicted RNA polymerase sigma factor